MVRHSGAVAATAPMARSGPTRRRATIAMPTMARPLTSATPTAVPAPPPKSFTGSASTSKYGGPGWLISVPAVSDARSRFPGGGDGC